MNKETCSDCWHTAVVPVTLTDLDGSTRIVCEAHTLSPLAFLERIEAQYGVGA